VDSNLTVSEDLSDDLLALGTRSQAVLIVPDVNSIEMMPLPEAPAVLSYLPTLEHVFYGSELSAA
jgi:hypothetical protein